MTVEAQCDYFLLLCVLWAIADDPESYRATSGVQEPEAIGKQRDRRAMVSVVVDQSVNQRWRDGYAEFCEGNVENITAAPRLEEFPRNVCESVDSVCLRNIRLDGLEAAEYVVSFKVQRVIDVQNDAPDGFQQLLESAVFVPRRHAAHSESTKTESS